MITTRKENKNRLASPLADSIPREVDSTTEEPKPKKHKTKQCNFCESTEDVKGSLKCCREHAVVKRPRLISRRL